MTPRRLILVVIDGLTPSMLEGTIGSGETPMLSALAECGSYRRATSVFPSLTPVCLSSIATGGHGDVHEIPHLVWYDRREGRVVEYGSSFGAVRAAGIGQTLQDTLVNLNAHHLGANAVTVFEALADAGLRTAATNFTAYRGRTRHRSSLPFLPDVRGPERFFFYNLYSSDRTGAPLSWRNRSAGSIDAYATAVGRWLVTRDAFDFFLLYLSDYDYASHEHGPDSALPTLQQCDAAIASLVEAGGGIESFLERYAVVVMSDHGQTRVRESASIGAAVVGIEGVLPLASNRAAQLYLSAACQLDARRVADRLDSFAAAEVVLFREGVHAVARREGEELAFAPDGRSGFDCSGDTSILGYPDGLARSWAALANPNAGDVLVSAAEGYEFADLGGGHHVGGGSHGSLVTGDSEVPLLTVGLDAPLGSDQRVSIVDVAPLILAHFGVEIPGYALRRAA
ncbi:alkaline phosphatase family protein [Gaiella sp.]|uniref:alkaline phosphatase family protein n=1 Tax=Gaiella sp. TaxID=2663207 RepID=UPI0039839919